CRISCRISLAGDGIRFRGVIWTSTGISTGWRRSPMASEALAPQRMSARLAGSFILCALVMIIDGYDLTAMSLAVPHLVREWGVPPSHFGIALSAAVPGLGAGALLLAPLGDRWGRRPVVIVSTIAIALATLGTATAGSVTELALWRLLTG